MKRWLFLTAIALVSVGCGSTDQEVAVTTVAAPTTVTATTIDPDAVDSAELVNEYVAQAAAFDQVGADSQFPSDVVFSAGGAPGYSRYVFRDNGREVVPTLVEGPIAGGRRCQDTDLPCSFLELKELAASGAPIPAELGLDEASLTQLVDQLSQLSEFALAHADVNAACADGFVSDRIQTPNMGSHFYKSEWINDGFDPSRPEILIYALADGSLPTGPVGQCANGRWNGEPMTLVGTSFIIPPSVIGNTHPEAFAGPLDNWHIHYNLCRGANVGRDSFVPQSECEAAGGRFSAALGWMIHAWVVPDFDNDIGVFAMWTQSISPATDSDSIEDSRLVRGTDFPDGAEQSLITDFRFDDDLRVRAGQALFFNNVDAVPHTVTAGSPDGADDDFDSGVLTPGSNFAVTFDAPGVYSLFCALHPDMRGTVEVID